MFFFFFTFVHVDVKISVIEAEGILTRLKQEKFLNYFIHFNLEDIFLSPFQITLNTKLRELQY